MIKVALKYGSLLAASLAAFSVMRVFVMTDVLDFDAAVTITAMIFIAAGTALGIWFNRQRANHSTLIIEQPTTDVPPTRLEAILSKRELEVFELLLQNKTNREISDSLFIEMSTLKTHVNRIYKKLDVSSRREMFVKFPATKSNSPANDVRVEPRLNS